MAPPLVQKLVPLDFTWVTQDPFLFCVHHDDAYPKGNARLGPAASLQGRNIGMDFEGIDGWRMYHGDVVPGFPSHPHRGFETVTVVRRGYIDHCDSLGATGRYGQGDVQWMTAGRGIVHSEMFPLLEQEQKNPCELFQIWLNLPAKNKMVTPHFAMLWGDTLPRKVFFDDKKRATELVVVAGQHPDLPTPPPPPPQSWASQPGANVVIWTLKMTPGATHTLPATPAGVQRMLYFFAGETMGIAETQVQVRHGATLRPETAVTLKNGGQESELLLLAGRPIQEPVAQQGPFVMNTRQEILQAFADYQRTQFGGWPWPRNDFVHPRDQERFARDPKGKVTTPKPG